MTATDAAGIVALARHLRDNADRLWLLAQGWQPPLDGSGPKSLAELAADTARLAARLAGLDRVRLPEPRTGDETDDETPASHHPKRG